MIIGGLQKFTISDFPGRISAIVFTRGCNFRCPYCHNPELVDPDRYVSPITEESVFAFLNSRIGQLDGVVVTGGEPTIHEDLPRFLGALRQLGFAVKLDTNGSNPGQLRQVIDQHLVDCIALDIKAPLAEYSRVAGVTVDPRILRESIRLVIDSGIPHEMRTTFCPSLLSVDDLRSIAREVQGCDLFVVQGFRPSKALDPGMLEAAVPTQEMLKEIQADIAATGVRCLVRSEEIPFSSTLSNIRSSAGLVPLQPSTTAALHCMYCSRLCRVHPTGGLSITSRRLAILSASFTSLAETDIRGACSTCSLLRSAFSRLLSSVTSATISRTSLPKRSSISPKLTPTSSTVS